MDICYHLKEPVPDEVKAKLIDNRMPSASFKFPPKTYKDKGKRSGEAKRHCKLEWLEIFTYTAYSRKQDGIYCLPCVLFPSEAHRGKRADLLITAPYRNWKDGRADLNKHQVQQYHKDSLAKYSEFRRTLERPSQRIEATISSASATQVKENRDFLTPIIAWR